MHRAMVRFYCIALILCGPAFASGVTPAAEVLPVDDAFRLSAQRAEQGIEIRFEVTPDHYLYRDRISVHTGDVPAGLDLPPGNAKDDPYFGRVQVLEQGFSVTLPADHSGRFTVRYQGCAEAGFCYPPQRSAFSIEADDTSLYISEDPKNPRKKLPF